MSANSNNEKGSGAGADKAPRLLAGGYAAWKDVADNWLDTRGAQGVHRKPLEAAVWRQRRDKADALRDEELAQAFADGDIEESKASDKARKATQLHFVDNSIRVYGLLYSCLAEELRLQVAHIDKGHAYGLWHWLETKFQSSESDSVYVLLSDWMSLQMMDGESFDSYRARVDKVKTLLEHAKEPVSVRVYEYTLLRRLQPRYKLAVLALQANGMLKDANNVDWDAVTAFVNAYERSEMRLESAHADVGSAMALRHDGRSYSKAASHPTGAGNSAAGSSSDTHSHSDQNVHRGGFRGGRG